MRSGTARASMRTSGAIGASGMQIVGHIHIHRLNALSVPVHWRFRFLVAPPSSGELLICAKDLFVEAMDRKGPSHTGVRARPGQVKQSGTTSEFGPIRSAASCRAERFLSGGRRRPGTCQICAKELFIAAIGHYKLVR